MRLAHGIYTALSLSSAQRQPHLIQGKIQGKDHGL